MEELPTKRLIACGLWRQFADCLSADPELFFPVSASGPGLRQEEEAKAICAGCQVRSQFLTFETLTRQEHGIWGGRTEEERRALWAGRSRAAEGRLRTGYRRAGRVELNARRPAADSGSPARHLSRKDHVMTRPALMLLQAEFARTASQQRTEEDLHILRRSADRAGRLCGAWEDRAAAHAEFHSLLADATGVSAYSLLGRLINGSVRDMIAWAGPPAGDFITASHRRLIRHLETRDADGAARETEHYLARLGECQVGQAAVSR